MKSDEWYTLNTAIKSIKEKIQMLDDEIENLDPSATWELKMISARFKGVLAYMEEAHVK